MLNHRPRPPKKEATTRLQVYDGIWVSRLSSTWFICGEFLLQERLSDLIGPYWGTYGIVYRVTQPVLAGLRQRRRMMRLGTSDS